MTWCRGSDGLEALNRGISMSNTLSVYDPLFYAQESLTALEKALGMAGRVHRGYDKTSQQKGSIISITKPGEFTAADAPSAAQGIAASEVQIALSNWREVKFALTDKELAYTTEKIISDHLRPAAYAIADDIDGKLCALYKNIPWYADTTSPAAIADMTACRKILFNNKSPMDDLHLMLSGTLEAEFLNLAAFSALATTSGEQTQMRGTLGNKFGFEVFANQNVATHNGTTLTDHTGALTADTVKGASSIAIGSIDATGALKIGDIITITGDTQQYVVTADITASGGAATVTTAPVQSKINSSGAVVEVTAAAKVESLAFQRNAFALAMAPLSELGNQLGAKVATVVDSITGLALRSRLFYIGDSSLVNVAIDVLYGVKTLNCNLAVRLRD